MSNPYEAPVVASFVEATPKLSMHNGKRVLVLEAMGQIVAIVDLAKINDMIRFYGLAR